MSRAEIEMHLIADSHGGSVKPTVDQDRDGRWLHVTHLNVIFLPADLSAMIRELVNVLLDADCTLILHSTRTGDRDLTAVYSRSATPAEVGEELARRGQVRRASMTPEEQADADRYIGTGNGA